MIEKIVALLLGDLFKKKPYRLWGIKMNDKKWRNFGTGSYHRLATYSVILFSEGWRTIILGKDIVEPAVPPNNEVLTKTTVPLNKVLKMQIPKGI